MRLRYAVQVTIWVDAKSKAGARDTVARALIESDSLGSCRFDSITDERVSLSERDVRSAIIDAYRAVEGVNK